MAATAERTAQAEQAFKRRMAKRVCGHCGAPAEDMKDWGSQRIAICGECEDRLNQPGFRCLLGNYPCEKCFVPPPIEARIVDAELVESTTVLAPAATSPVTRVPLLTGVLAALRGLLRR